MRSKANLIGKRFGRLTVISEAPRNGFAKPRFNCICDCGNGAVAIGNNLKTGNHKSCGCQKREKTIARLTKHGLHGTPTYEIWKGIRSRCLCANDTSYKRYGGRGISVCKRWNSFKHFLTDMGERPSGKWIGRIDNDGNYEPSNCRWETIEQQQNNRRNNHVITFRGQSKTIAQWSRSIGIGSMCLLKRFRRGWSTSVPLTKSAREITTQSKARS